MKQQTGSGRASVQAPPWDQAELLRLMDVQAHGGCRYVAPAHGSGDRNVVEAGQLLGDAVVAASKEIPSHRVTSASMVFSRAATHDAPVELDLDVLRSGRTLATVQARSTQHGSLRSAGTVLMDAGAPDLVRSAAPMPDVDPPGRLHSIEYPGMVVGGRDMRVVDDAYDWDPEHVGPPELFVWTRFEESPGPGYLHAALLSQSTTHWTIAAALRPHAGFSETMAHESISTGITMVTVAYHDPVDVTRWLLYATRVIYAGDGTAQSEGRVYTEEGRLVASYTVHAILRAFARGKANSAQGTVL